MAASATACTGFQQVKVKVWLSSGCEIELIFSCEEFYRHITAKSDAEGRHPAGFGIDHERGGGERNAVGYCASGLVQAENPGLASQRRRQRQLTELDERQRQYATEQRGIDQVIHQIIEPEPKRGGGSQLGVTAADPASRKETETNRQHQRAGG